MQVGVPNMLDRAHHLVVHILLNIHDLSNIRLRVVFRDVAICVSWRVSSHLCLVLLFSQLYVL